MNINEATPDDFPLIARGTALRGPHGEIAEYIDGDADWFGAPAVTIRRMAGIEVTVASAIGSTWIPVPGRVVVHEHQTGRWTTPVQRWLEVLETSD